MPTHLPCLRVLLSCVLFCVMYIALYIVAYVCVPCSYVEENKILYFKKIICMIQSYQSHFIQRNIYLHLMPRIQHFNFLIFCTGFELPDIQHSILFISYSAQYFNHLIFSTTFNCYTIHIIAL